MLWQQLQRCFSSSLFAKIFLGKPGLLLSIDDGGEGSCVAMTPSLGLCQNNERCQHTASSEVGYWQIHNGP